MKNDFECPSCKSNNVTTERISNDGYNYCNECNVQWKRSDLSEVIIDTRTKQNPPKIEIRFIKTHPDAILPTKANDSDTGYDVYAVEDTFLPAKGSAKVNCGLNVAYISEGFWFSSRSRSGLAFRNDVVSFHGTIDQGYRNDLGLKLFNFSNEDYLIKAGERVCQIAIQPVYHADMSFVESVQDKTDRGLNGFGSSGK